MDFRTALKTHFRFKNGRPGGTSCPAVVFRRHRRASGMLSGPLTLAELARDLGTRVGVEIGTYLGDSATLWCKINPELQLTCIDPYRAYNGRQSQVTQDEIYKTALENLKPYNATIVRKPSMDAVSGFADGSLDFLSIDGDHSFDAAVMDLVLWCPKVKKGGLVLVHDYTSNQGPHVIRAVDSYTHCHSIHQWYSTMDWTPTVFWEAQ